MNCRSLFFFLVLLVLPACGHTQETPEKPDVWKSAGTRHATYAEIQALIATPGPALLNRNPCRATPILWGTGSPADGAAARLVEIGEPAITPVLPLLEDKEMWRRRLAVEILGRIGNRRVTPVLLKRLQTEKDENVQAALAASLSMLRDSRAESALTRLVHEGPQAALWQSMVGLARLHSRHSLQPLFALLPAVNDPNAPHVSKELWQAEMATSALAEGGAPVFPALLRLLSNRNTPAPALARAVTPAAALGDKRLLPILLRLLDHPDDGVRNAAVTHLTPWQDARVFPALVRVLHGSAGQAQMSAGIALAKLGSPEALEVLAQATDSEDENLHHAAANACRYLETRSASPMLLHLLKEGRKDTPQYAAYALGNLKEKSAIPALGEALARPSAELRSAAATALGNFYSTAAVGSLLQALDDPSKEVRLIAVRLLRDKKDARIVPAYERLRSDPDKEVQREADFGIKWQQTARLHTED